MSRIISLNEPVAPRGANRDRLRHYNESLVLDTIRTCQPIPQIEIAGRTGLQRSTTSIIVDRILRKGVIRLSPGERSGRPGRQRVPLVLNPDYRHVLGVALSPAGYTLAVGDFNGEIVSRETFRCPRDSAAFQHDLVRRVGCLRGAHPVKIGGLAISCPGLVDSARRLLSLSVHLGWRNVDFSPLADRIGVPVLVDNDARLGALAEIWGHDRRSGNFAYVLTGEGLGVSLVLDGHIYRGRHDYGSEFGHVPLDPRGPSCSCGRRGCWEAYVSAPAILKRYVSIKGSRATPASLSDLIARALNGDGAAKKALRISGLYLGRGLLNLSVAFNSEKVVVGGTLTPAWPILEPVVRETIAREGAPLRLEQLPILTSRFGESGPLHGAIALAASQFFPPLAELWTGCLGRGLAQGAKRT